MCRSINWLGPRVKRRPIAIFKYQQGKLEPWARIDREAMATWKDGAIIEAHPYNERQSEQNRLLHGILSIGAENSLGNTVESLKLEIKDRGGWVKAKVQRRDGSWAIEYRSTTTFDAVEYDIFIDEAKTFIADELGLDVDTLIDEAKARSAVTKGTRK